MENPNETTQPQPETTPPRPTTPPPAPEKRRIFETSMSENFHLLAGALARAQGNYKPVVKNCEGKVTYPARGDRPAGSYTFMYADLGAVIDATKEALAAEEIAHTTLIGSGKLRVMLLHSSGQWMASETALASPADGMHPFGSQITYLRRYLLGPMIGVASEDDDDGNAGEGNQFDKTKGGSHGGTQGGSSNSARAATKDKPAPAPKDAPASNKITPAQITKLGEAMDAMPEFIELQKAIDDPKVYNARRLEWINKALGLSGEKALPSPRDITQDQLSRVLQIIAASAAIEGGAK